ncbi:hypothetical protein K438DRAFT_1878381 [Mycena galopus ATCC 62051]|nr:hypothetical protein K438DRAFT_1878381 [Mycena galopus ATCC 62051]
MPLLVLWVRRWLWMLNCIFPKSRCLPLASNVLPRPSEAISTLFTSKSKPTRYTYGRYSGALHFCLSSTKTSYLWVPPLTESQLPLVEHHGLVSMVFKKSRHNH